MARPCRGCGRALIFWPPFTETERVQSEVEEIGEHAPAHEDAKCAETQDRLRRAYAARPKCKVEGCPMLATTRVRDYVCGRESLGLGRMLRGAAWLLCDGHAARNGDIEETTDGRLLDRRMLR